MKMKAFWTWSFLLALAGGWSLLAQTATWTEITHPTSPAFAHHDMTYDSLRHRLIVAGRTSIMQPPFAIFAGAVDGSWTELPAPSPAIPGFTDIELAYDSYRDVVVLYTSATNKVWEFNGTNWSMITAHTVPIQCFDGALLQYDPIRRKTVLVATDGYPNPGSPSETWTWDGVDWTRVADTNASPRSAAGGGMAFDAARGEMVLLTMSTMQTWTFNGTNWTLRTPATVPSPPRWVFDLAYDPVSQLSVFFCGETMDGSWSYPREIWAWNGADWHRSAPAIAPEETIDYSLTAFPERGGLVLHGGWGNPEWEFRTNVWLLTLQSSTPSTIRLADIRLLDSQVRLVSIGQVKTGAVQVIQSAASLSASPAWVNVLTNPAPAATNTWLIPRQANQFFRVLERD